MNSLRPIEQRLSRVSQRSTLCTSTQRWFSGPPNLAVELMTPRCLPDPQARLSGVPRVGGQALVRPSSPLYEKPLLADIKTPDQAVLDLENMAGLLVEQHVSVPENLPRLHHSADAMT